MASITKRNNKTGPEKWQVFIRENGVRIIKTFATRAEAEEFAVDVERETRRALQAKVDPFASLPPSGDWMDEKLLTTLALFAKGKKYIPRHAPIIASLKRNLDPSTTIGDLDQDWIENYIKTRSRKKSIRGRPFKLATLVGHMVVVNIVLKWRAQQLKHPKPEFSVDKSVLPAGWDCRRERRLEDGEETALMTAFRCNRTKSQRERYQFRLLFRLALETGARLQELVLAEWSELHITRKMWRIPASHTKCKRERTVPLSPRALRIVRLLALMKTQGNPKAFPDLPAPNLVSGWFHDLTIKAGVADFRFHDLRHEAIARFVMHPDRYQVPKLMKIVGHADYATFDRYLTFRESELEGFMS